MSSSTAASKKRIPYVDNLKGILILLVVIGHLNAYMDTSNCEFAIALSNFIYTFHMPLFLFCSGLFIAKSGQERGPYKQVVSGVAFLIVYVLFYLAGAVISAIAGAQPSFNFLKVDWGPWYLLVLGIYLIISPLFSRIKFGWALCLALILSVANCVFNQNRIFLSSSRFFTYLPWFVMGYYLTGAKLIELREKLNVTTKRHALSSAIAVAILAFYLLTIYVILPDDVVALSRQLSTGLHTVNDINWVFGLSGTPMIIVLGLCRLLHHALVIVICAAVCVLVPMSHCLLEKWGRNSLQVYIVHLLVLYGVNDFWGTKTLCAQIGLNTNLWVTILPFVLAPIVTALLAWGNAPNKWLAALRRLVGKAAA